MPTFTLTLTATPGCSITTATDAALRIAFSLDVAVVFNFNDVDVYVCPTDSVTYVVEQYHQAVNRLWPTPQD